MTLREVQLSVLQILKDIDAHCKTYNIKYSLAFGTLLGAIRHNGFIPWDDDLDIYMPREDYNRFLETWNYEQYYLVNQSTETRYTNTFTKVKRVKDINSKAPFFVDIFPLEKCPKKSFERRLLQLKGACLILLTRKYVPLKTGSLLEKVVKFCLKMTPSFVTSRMISFLEREISKYQNLSSGFDYVCCDVMHDIGRFIPQSVFENLTLHQFEDSLFPIIEDYDWYLKKEYGDYMQLPPIEKRVAPHFDDLQ